MSRLFHMDDDIEHVASAVCEAYTPEGVDIWWRNWIHADAEKRQRMERGITDPSMWSGERPDNARESCVSGTIRQVADPNERMRHG